jgi:hypothetical protein
MLTVVHNLSVTYFFIYFMKLTDNSLCTFFFLTHVNESVLVGGGSTNLIKHHVAAILKQKQPRGPATEHVGAIRTPSETSRSGSMRVKTMYEKIATDVEGSVGR